MADEDNNPKSQLLETVNEYVKNSNTDVKPDFISEDFDYKIESSFQGTERNSEPIGRVSPLMTDDIYLQERVSSQIDWHNRKSSVMQKTYKRFKRLEFLLAASIPVCVGFISMDIVTKVKYLDTVLQMLIALAGIILVFLNKLFELEEYFKLWKDYRVTAEQLEHERMLYLCRSEPYDEANAYPLFVETIESILNQNIQRWRQVTHPKQEKEGTEKREGKVTVTMSDEQNP